MEQIPLKAYYNNGKVDGISEFQQGEQISHEFISVLPKEKLGLRLDAWLVGVDVTSMIYDDQDNLSWVVYETGHKVNIFYDESNDWLMYKVDYFLVDDKMNTLELFYDDGGNLINTNWIYHQ